MREMNRKRRPVMQYIVPLFLLLSLGSSTLWCYQKYQKEQELTDRIQAQNKKLIDKIQGLEKENVSISSSLHQKSEEVLQKNQELEQKEKEINATKQQLGNIHQTLADLGVHLNGGSLAFSQTVQVKATAYSADPAENGGTYNGKVLTKTGFNLTDNPQAKVIAVDPRIIPLGSTVWVEGYGFAKALDTGGAIKGNRIDVFIANKQLMNSWGVRNIEVKVVAEA